MLHPTSPRRERILLYGPWSSGKSSAWLSIAQWIAKTEPKSRILALDTDRAWEAMDPGNLDGIVTIRNAPEWLDMKAGIKELVETGTRDDFLVIDLADKPWSKAQEAFWEYQTDKDFDEFLMETSKTVDNLAVALAGDHGANWGIINKMYSAFSSSLQRFPGHIIACVGATDIREPNRSGKGGDSSEIRQQYGRLGLKPTGQKDLPHLFHTILLMQEKKVGEEWVITTAKERGPIGQPKRPYLKGEKVDDFVMSYLFKVAGWKP